MKRIKFSADLTDLIKAGTKTSTWRLFDDKDLREGDEVELYDRGRDEVFARAVLTRVNTKKFAELAEEDLSGHEPYESNQSMYRAYSSYYGQAVGPETELKIVHFILI